MDASVRAVERELVRSVVAGRGGSKRGPREEARRVRRMVACEAAASTRDYFRVVRSTCRRQPCCVRVKILFTVAGRLAACQFWEYVSVAVSVRRKLLPPPRGPICPRFVILTRATIGERPRDCGDSPELPGFLLVAARMLAARSRFAAIKLHITCREPCERRRREPAAVEKALFSE